MDAIRQLLTTAIEKRWCMKYGCTTCGAFEFRDAVAASSGEILDALKTLRILDLFAEFPIGEIRGGFELLLSEIANPFGMGLTQGRLPRVELRGTEVGEFLERRERAIAARMKAAAERRAFRALHESPEAVAERRRSKREAAEARQAVRLAAKSARECEQQQACEALAGLEPADLIRSLCERGTGTPLYRLSEVVISRVVLALETATDADLDRLRAVVPITRVRPLAVLSQAIDAQRRVRVGESESEGRG